jgi:hypothetical protein
MRADLIKDVLGEMGAAFVQKKLDALKNSYELIAAGSNELAVSYRRQYESTVARMAA